MSSNASIIFMGVGDVILGNPPNPHGLFEPTLSTFRQADILFGQNETSYSLNREVLPQARGNLCFHPRNIEALQRARFDIMSVCSNHSMDYGYSALVDTIDGIRNAGIETVGAGRNIEEAASFRVIERGGVKVAFLAYAPASDKTYNCPGRTARQQPNGDLHALSRGGARLSGGESEDIYLSGSRSP